MMPRHRSTFAFTSNVYPVTTRSPFEDKEFMAQVHDLKLFSAMNSNPNFQLGLTDLQSSEKSRLAHCAYAKRDEFVWGTARCGKDASLAVECRCENVSCQFFAECRPDIAKVAKSMRLGTKRAPLWRPEKASAGIDGLYIPLEETPHGVVIPDKSCEAAEVDAPRIILNETSWKTPQSLLEDLPNKGGESQESLKDIQEWSVLEDEADEPVQTYRALSGKRYDADQALVVEAEATKRLYVNAGPGTGKTFTLIERLIYLIDECGVDPESILVLSYTRAAVGEVKTRLQKAALEGRFKGAWQNIDVSTFDKFATKLLFWIRDEHPDMLHASIPSLDYDARITAARRVIEQMPEVVGLCQHLVVDETQDLVKCRADFTLQLIDALDDAYGITLFGDRCQSLYDYDCKKERETRSEDFYNKVTGQLGFEQVSLTHNYRQAKGLPYDLEPLRDGLLNRDQHKVKDAINGIQSSIDHLSESLADVRESDVVPLLRDGSLAILTRSNVQAVCASSALWKSGIAHRMTRAERDVCISRSIVDVLWEYEQQTIKEETFVERVVQTGVQVDVARTMWNDLTRLHGVHPEGDRYRIENLLVSLLEVADNGFGGLAPSLGSNRTLDAAVTVSTVHGAKGKEFGTVWLLEEVVELATKDNLDEGNQDEGKVVYVGLSRPQKNASLCKLGMHGGVRATINNCDRCFRMSGSNRKASSMRKKKRRVTHIEIVNIEDIDFNSVANTAGFQKSLHEGKLDGVPIRLRRTSSHDGWASYEILWDGDKIRVLGSMKSDFSLAYSKCWQHATKINERDLPTGFEDFPEGFDELYIDRIVSCVGPARNRADGSSKVFGEMAIWYGFTLGGFAHADNSTSH